MKKEKSLGLGLTFILGLLLLMLCLFSSKSILADEIKSSIPSYNGRLELHSDNTATFIEEVTFEYENDYNGQYITLGKAGKMPPGFDIEDQPQVRIKTNGQAREPEHVYEEEIKDGKKLKIYNSGNSGDRVTITVIWQLRNLLWLYQDVAELNWIPISDADENIEEVTFTIQTDKEDKASKLYAHTGYFAQTPKISKEGRIYTVKVDGIVSMNDFQLTGVWNRNLFQDSDPSLILKSERLKKFESKEQTLQIKGKIYRFIAYLVVPALVLALVLRSLSYLRRFLKKTKPIKLPKNTRLYEIPQNLSPLLVAHNIYDISIEDVGPIRNYKKKLTFSNIVQATFLDLIDRGNLAYQAGESGAWLTVLHYDQMTDYELALLEMAFGNEESVRTDSMFAAYQFDKKILKGKHSKEEILQIRSQGNEVRGKIVKNLHKIARAVWDEEQALGLHSHYRELNREETQLMERGCSTGCLAPFLLGLACLFVAFFFGEYIWQYFLGLFLLIPIGIVLCIRVNLRKRKRVNPDYLDELLQWQSFENMLRDIARLDQTDLQGIVLWNRILVYATLYGYADRVSKTLKSKEIHLELPEIENFLSTSQNLHILSSINHFNDNVQTVESASSFSLPSDNSGWGDFGGGGFSDGGGGGGGMGSF